MILASQSDDDLKKNGLTLKTFRFEECERNQQKSQQPSEGSERICM